MLTSEWANLFNLAHETVSDRRIAREFGDADTWRSTIREYRKEKRPKNASSAWDRGEALHRAGLPWASGWIALECAGAYVELVDFITAMSILEVGDATGTRGRIHVARAASIALASTMLLRDGIARTVADRPQLLSDSYDAIALEAAWDAVTSKPAYVRAHQRTDLQLARVFAEARDLSDDDRRQGIAEHLFRWVERYQPDVLKKNREIVFLYAMRRNGEELKRLHAAPFGRERVKMTADAFSARLTARAFNAR